jgi:YVTN family beta-propeller protein
VQNVAITGDSRWAVVCGFDAATVSVVDLTTDAVVAEVPAGSRAGVVALSPDDTRAYVGNISANTLSVIALDGASSYKIADVPCGVIGVLWTAYGVQSGVACSPAGDVVLVAASFDDQVKVVDTATNAVLASVPVGDFPLQIAFDDDGSHATVTNYFDDSYSILEIDGAATHVIGTWSRGLWPLRLAHNPVDTEMAVVHVSSKTLVRFHPETGAYLGTTSFGAYGAPIQAIFDEGGEPLVLTQPDGETPAYVHRAGETFALPATPSYFDYNAARQRAVAVMPGPDWATVIEWDLTGAPAGFPVDASTPGSLEPASPNPFCASTQLAFSLDAAGPAELAIHDVRGRRVRALSDGERGAGRHVLAWDGRDDLGRRLPAGVYFASLRVDGFTQTRKVVVLR